MSSRTSWQVRFHSHYGPWAVVTGASDGIGRELATRLADAGLHVVLVARRHERLLALANELGGRYGVEARAIAADLTDRTGIELILRETSELDVGLLVAAAGFGTSGPLHDASLDVELDMLDLNCRAVLALTHTFSQRLVQRGRGGMILLSSLVAFQGVPRAANYAATKAYVQTLAEGLRLELAPHGVDVLASAPGPVATGFADRADMRMARAASPAEIGQVTLEALGRQTTVRPGWLAKLLGYSLATLPRAGRSRVMAKLMRRITQHQHERTNG